MFSNRNVRYHALFFCYIQLQILFSLQPEVVRVIWTPIYHLPLLTLGLTAAKLCSSRAVVVLVIQSGPCCCSSRYVCISFCFQKWAGEKMWLKRKIWNWITNISLFLETFNDSIIIFCKKIYTMQMLVYHFS